MDTENESDKHIKMSSLVATVWAEQYGIRNLLARDALKAIPSFVILQLLKNTDHTNDGMANSERTQQAIKRMLLQNSRLLSEETTELAIYMFRFLEHDLRNMAGHRFFSRLSFPNYLKYRGLGFLPSLEQQVMLLRTMSIQGNLSKIIDGYKDFQETLIDTDSPSLEFYGSETKAMIAHRAITETTMEELVRSHNRVINQCLSYNPRTTENILQQIWKNNEELHKDETVRILVASHPNLSQDYATSLLSSDDALHFRSAKTIIERAEELDIEELLERCSSLSEIPWNTLRGISANSQISYQQVLRVIELGYTGDFEIVFYLLANRNVSELAKELLKAGLQNDLVFH